MDSSEASMPAPKAVEVPAKGVSTAPDGYKIVKVWKPDGTIVKVRRPIAKVRGTETVPSVSNHSAKGLEKSDEVEPRLSGPVKSTLAAEVPASNTTPQVTAAKSSATTSKEVSPTKQATPPVHASKLETTARSYRLFRKVHRVHKHPSKLVEAFDPYSEVGDFQDGDESLGSDDEYGDSVSEDSNYDDRSDQAKQSNSKSATKGASIGAHANVNVGSNAATHRPVPTPKEDKSNVAVKEVSGNKSSSSDTDIVIREKELLDAHGLENAKTAALPPRSLHRRSADWAKLIVWTLVIVFPLFFIALAIAIATLNLTSYPSGRGEAIRIANKAGITMWPIVFAAIVAQTLKALATYRVERGIRLMTLEQLISSHSVASALKQPFVLRSLNWLTLGLLMLWGLSPLGSQAMQYTMNNADHWIYNSTSVYYLNTAQDNLALQQIATVDQFDVKTSYSDSMAVLYSAVFQPVSAYQPIGSDPWGNPLVPVYEIVKSQTPVEKDPQGGLFVHRWNATDNTDLYSSFYGIPLGQLYQYENVSYGATWTFNMISSYLHFDCPSLTANTSAEIDTSDWHIQSTLNGTGSLSMDMNPPTSTSPGSLFFRSECSERIAPDGNRTFAYAICSFTQTFVNSTVYCEDTDCKIRSVSEITRDPTSMYDFVEEFLKASDVGLDDYPDLGDTPYSATELYLRNPYNVTTPPDDNEVLQSCDIPSVGVEEFTKRLNYLMNTFYSTGFTTEYGFGALVPNTTIQLYRNDGQTEYNASLTAQTEGTTQFQDPKTPTTYVIDWVFLAIFVFCSVVLLVIGVAGILLEMRTISPDIMGFASSVARHSKYVKLPHTDGTMSGAEKARILGATKVMMQDVRPSAEIGKIVLGSASEEAERLKPGRRYR